jgi:VIT1/CCC1 family predicted Fe2+/Mn2+ transporter
VEMGSYLYMGAFVLALGSLYGLTSNFSCPRACLRQSSCSIYAALASTYEGKHVAFDFLSPAYFA